MPELPEVETVCRGLKAANLPGNQVLGGRCSWDPTLAGYSSDIFLKRLQASTIITLSRRGKFIVLVLDSGLILGIHLRMTGKLLLEHSQFPRHPHERVALALSDGRELRYLDSRKFGRWYLSPQANLKLQELGPEPLEKSLKAKNWHPMLIKRKRSLKSLLLDQTFLAGVGNIYADEALWDAGLHPETPSNQLSLEKTRRLLQSIRKVLKRGIRNQGTTLGRGDTTFLSVGRKPGNNVRYLKVFRHTHEPCPRCGTPIERIRVQNRSTHLCPHCQKLS